MLTPKLIRVLREIDIRDALSYSKSIVDRLQVSIDLGAISMDREVIFSKGLAWVSKKPSPPKEQLRQVREDIKNGVDNYASYTEAQKQEFNRLKSVLDDFNKITKD